MENKRNDLGYLGIEFQYRLVHHFMDDKKFFGDMYDIIDNNMFTEPNLKKFVRGICEYYYKYSCVPSYEQLEIKLRSESKSAQDLEYVISTIEKIQDTTCEGSDEIKTLAQKFFRQQNFVKFNNKISDLLKNGDIDNFDELEELWQKALSAGNRDEIGISLRDNLGEVLSEDYRNTIPTGIDGIDESLEGGIGKGELGVIIGPSSFGKMQSINELICTPNGFVRNGDLRVGDYVIGQNGLPTRVTGIFPQGIQKLYKVEFSDGVSCDSGLEHLWNVNSSEQRNSKEPDNSFKTISLREILENGLYVNFENLSFYNFKVPMAEPVHFNERKISFDPYVVGYMISREKPDKDLSVLTDIESNSKFIHEDYLYNSIENRIKLLNGLMDCNGTCKKNGSVCYTTKSKKLAENVKTLVLSLGGFACLKEKYDKKSINNEIQYEVTFVICDSTIPIFKIKRKQNRVVYQKNGERFISKVEYIGDEECQCIKVDAEDELYLTRDFIVTHNTSLTTSLANYAALKGNKVVQIVFEDKPKQIQRKHIGKITGIESRNLSKAENIEYVKDIMSSCDSFDNNLKIKKFNTGEVSPIQIRNYLKRLINSGFKPDLVIVDYFECLVPSKNFKDQWTGEGHTMRQLESIASDLDIGLWVPTQGTKESMNVDIVTMDKAGGSFKKIQIAHIVISISRAIEDIENNVATIAVLKNRSGKSGKVMENVYFNNGTCEIRTDNANSFDGMSKYNEKENKEKQSMQESLLKKKIAARTGNTRNDEEF